MSYFVGNYPTLSHIRCQLFGRPKMVLFSVIDASLTVLISVIECSTYPKVRAIARRLYVGVNRARCVLPLPVMDNTVFATNPVPLIASSLHSQCLGNSHNCICSLLSVCVQKEFLDGLHVGSGDRPCLGSGIPAAAETLNVVLNKEGLAGDRKGGVLFSESESTLCHGGMFSGDTNQTPLSHGARGSTFTDEPKRFFLASWPPGLLSSWPFGSPSCDCLWLLCLWLLWLRILV